MYKWMMTRGTPILGNGHMQFESFRFMTFWLVPLLGVAARYRVQSLFEGRPLNFFSGYILQSRIQVAKLYKNKTN